MPRISSAVVEVALILSVTGYLVYSKKISANFLFFVALGCSRRLFPGALLQPEDDDHHHDE